MNFIVLKEDTTILNVQRLYLNENCCDCFGKFAFVKDSAGQIFICRVWRKKNLHRDFCVLNGSVSVVQNGPVQRSGEYICDIKTIPKVSIVKSLAINIVLNDIEDRLKWSDKRATLLSTIKDILSLFVVASNSVIDLSGLKEINGLGFQCVQIVSTGAVEVGKIVPSTKVKINSLYCYETFKQFELDMPLDILGKPKASEELRDLIVSRKKLCGKREIAFLSHILLVGPGGSGKKTLVTKLCWDVKATILNLDLMNVIQRKQSLLDMDKVLTKAQLLAEESPLGLCVILIKNIDTYCSKPGKVLCKLLKLIEEANGSSDVMIVGTAENALYVHQSLRTANRFGVELYLGIPSEKERKEVVTNFLKDKLSEECLDHIAEGTPGFVLSDLLLLAKKISRLGIPDEINNQNEIKKALAPLINETMPSKRKGLIGSTSEVTFNMDNLGGLKDIKKQLNHAIVWPLNHPEAFSRFNIRQPSGVLLYGPPGCAKTSLARAVASLTKTSFLSVSAADLFSPYVGDAEKTISQLFQRARASAPTILFIDEIDALVGSRGFREKGSQERILTSFLSEMDGIGINRDQEPGLVGDKSLFVFVIGATNRPQVIDSALLRPGRLDKLLFVPPPSMEDRLEILQKITSNMPLSDDVSLKEIAECAEFYSGADLVNLCREAGLLALQFNGMDVSHVEHEHFTEALDSMKPSLSAEQLQWYSTFSFSQ